MKYPTYCDQHEPFVYVVGTTEGKAPALVKIGFAKNVENRIAQMQAGCPVALQAHRTYRGGHDLEYWLHQQFKRWRAHGEWFKLKGRIADIDAAVTRWHRDLWEAGSAAFVGCKATTCDIWQLN